jgi:hypothetical protein
MRRSLFACSVLALALTVTACQQGEPTPAEPAPVAAPGEVAMEAAPAPTEPAAPPPVVPTPAKEPQAGIPEGPDMAPRPVPVAETPCRETLGAAEADRLVKICRNVSPATRPPCNAANPCALIQNEIDRSCAMWTRDGNAPADCKAATPARP